MPEGSKIFLPCRSLGYVTNHIPLQVRYIKSRKENLIVTCVGKSFHTYGISHFGLLNVGGLHPDDITAMAADTYHVYTSCDRKIYAWRRGSELKHVYKGHRKPIHMMLPFGAHLISVDDSSNVKIWDIKSEAVYAELTFSNETFQISAIVHPSTYINKILLGSEQGEMQLWNINTIKMIYSFKGWKAAITCLQQAPAVDVVAVGLANGRIILHNLKFDETIMEFMQDWGVVTSISFRSDGNPIMATGCVMGHVVCWNLEERRVASQLLCAHSSSVTGMFFLPNEPLLLTSSSDNSLKLWIFDMSDGGGRLLRIREGHAAPPSYIRFRGSNGHNLLSSGSDSTLRIFNTQTEQFNKSLGKASHNRKASKKRGKVEDPLIMPPIIQFASETTREKEWDDIAAIHLGLPMATTWSYDRLKMGELKLLPECFHRKNMKSGKEVDASCVCLTSCGNYAVIGYSTGHVFRFNMQSGINRDVYGQPHAHDGPVRGVTTDSLNQLTITGGGDCQIKFWKFKSKGAKPLTVLTLEEPVNFFSSHSERSMFAVALENFDIYIVDVDTRRVVRKFMGHMAQITDATFTPDARWLITSSMDCSIRTWDIPSSRLIDQFSTQVACVSLNMSPTGEVLATAHVDYLGIYLWTNRALYSKFSPVALCPSDKPPLIAFPECSIEENDSEESEVVDEFEYASPEQISHELVTLSGLAQSRWQNLLNIDIIRKRNKPKAPPKAPKMAPFFLPTVSNLNFQFDLTQANSDSASKMLTTSSITNLTNLGKKLDETLDTGDFGAVVEKLKSFSPSVVDFEIKSLAPEGGGNFQVMLQFIKCIEFMLKSNKDFELAEMYFGVFLKSHGAVIAQHQELRNYLTNIQSCHDVVWARLQERMLYNICVVQNLKQ